MRCVIADFVCFARLLVELKAISEITNDHRGQLFNYLRITDSQAGLLINFGHPKMLVSERYLYNSFIRNYEYIRFK